MGVNTREVPVEYRGKDTPFCPGWRRFHCESAQWIVEAELPEGSQVQDREQAGFAETAVKCKRRLTPQSVLGRQRSGAS
jgi:hypothetical protein